MLLIRTIGWFWAKIYYDWRNSADGYQAGNWKLLKKINEFIVQYDNITSIDDMEISTFADEWPRILVGINSYLNDKCLKLPALYNIFYASSFQLATVMLHQPFPISCFNWSIEWNYVFFMDTIYKVFKYFQGVSFNKLGYWRGQG